MTKVEAIKKVMEDNGGVASWKIIYKNIEKYYPSIKSSISWQQGIRGVLYREISNSQSFKKLSFGIFALINYQEEKIKTENKIRMHSYIEGICIELGNFNNFYTYTADPSAIYKDNIKLSDITSLDEIPSFTYQDIIKTVSRIDVIWFNKTGYIFPKQVFEVVDSIGTLGEAFNRILQTSDFNTKFHIIGRKEYIKQFNNKLNRKPFNEFKDRYTFQSYEQLIDFYNIEVQRTKLKFF